MCLDRGSNMTRLWVGNPRAQPNIGVEKWARLERLGSSCKGVKRGCQSQGAEVLQGWGDAHPGRARHSDPSRMVGLSPEDVISQGGQEATAGPQLAEEPGTEPSGGTSCRLL